MIDPLLSVQMQILYPERLINGILHIHWHYWCSVGSRRVPGFYEDCSQFSSKFLGTISFQFKWLQSCCFFKSKSANLLKICSLLYWKMKTSLSSLFQLVTGFCTVSTPRQEGEYHFSTLYTIFQGFFIIENHNIPGFFQMYCHFSRFPSWVGTLPLL